LIQHILKFQACVVEGCEVKYFRGDCWHIHTTFFCLFSFWVAYISGHSPWWSP